MVRWVLAACRLIRFDIGIVDAGRGVVLIVFRLGDNAAAEQQCRIALLIASRLVIMRLSLMDRGGRRNVLLPGRISISPGLSELGAGLFDGYLVVVRIELNEELSCFNSIGCCRRRLR